MLPAFSTSVSVACALSTTAGLSEPSNVPQAMFTARLSAGAGSVQEFPPFRAGDVVVASASSPLCGRTMAVPAARGGGGDSAACTASGSTLAACPGAAWGVPPCPGCINCKRCSIFIGTLWGLSAASGIGAIDCDRDQVPNECFMLVDLAFVKLGTSIEAISATSAAAMPTGTSHRIARRRGRANSFGATVLKCWSSFCAALVA